MAKIMIVDDAAFMRTVLKDILIGMGHEIAGEAANGVEAIKLFSLMHPDLITMDITMPDMDGVTAVREIRRLDPKAKIIMCSAMGQQAMVLDAITAGARDFIVKPIQKDRVVEAINRALQGAGKRD